MFCWTLSGGWSGVFESAAVAVGDKLYSFENRGVADTDQLSVRIFNTVSLRWRMLPLKGRRGEPHLEIPSSRQGCPAVLVEDVIYLWGGLGYDGTIDDCDDVLYAFDVDTHKWFNPRVSGSVPERRGFHSACVLGKVMFIHGGISWTDKTFNDNMHKLDTTTMVWSLINTRGTPPPASDSHCSATIIGTKMFVVGGSYNTIRVFDTETNCWLNTPSAQLPPEGQRTFWFRSAFAYNGELYKLDCNTCDLWKSNPESISWKKVEPKGKGPSGKYSFGSICMVGDCVIFGGCRTEEDLFILDLSPSLKTLCKLAVIQYGLDQAGLTHDVRWELAAMATNGNRKPEKLL